MSIAVRWILNEFGDQKSFKNPFKNDPKANPKLIQKRHAKEIDFHTDLWSIWGRFWKPFGLEKLIKIDADFNMIFEQLENSIAPF